jgi:hypothetical protein
VVTGPFTLSGLEPLSYLQRRSVVDRENPRIRVSYDIVTPESAEEGDVAERGWIDEEGMEVDPWDEDETYVDEAVRMLEDEGVLEASSSEFHPGVWYSNNEYGHDYATGARESRYYHLDGFTVEEEAAIFRKLKL